MKHLFRKAFLGYDEGIEDVLAAEASNDFCCCPNPVMYSWGGRIRIIPQPQKTANTGKYFRRVTRSATRMLAHCAPRFARLIQSRTR